MSEQDDPTEKPEKLAQDQEPNGARAALARSDRLLHELRVHQIELEIQNRALREAQEQLEASRHRDVELFEAAPVAYLTLEADGRIVGMNVAASRLLGMDRADLLGRRLQTVVGLSDPLGFRAMLRDCAEQNRESRSEITFRTVAEESHTADMVMLPVSTPTDPGQVRVALHDVTARASAEQNLRFLSQAGARLSRIPLGTSRLLDEIAAAGAFAPAEGCWTELGGEEAVAWRNEPMRRELTGDVLQLVRTQIASSVRASRAAESTVVGRWTDDREARPLSPLVRSWVTAPLSPGGKVQGSVTLLHHVPAELEESSRTLTEEFARRASVVLEKAALFRRAEEAARSRDEMMAVLAHDLSNALFSFRLHAQRGLTRGGEQAQRALGVVARGSQLLLGLVKTVLDVAAMEGGRLRVQRQRSNLSPVLESACVLHQMDADQRRLHIKRSWPDEISLDFDHERLLQVLFNLVNNAVKFTPVGGRIEVGAAREGEKVRVWVRDSGKGLGPEQLERVFERGWQADPKAGGKGLGLYISRHIVEAHGGTISVESTPGRGTLFNLVLPSEASASESPNEAAASP